VFAVLRRRSFALLWVGGLVSGLGSSALSITLPFYVYTRTGSALAAGAMFVARLGPRLALGSLAGVFADRWDRRRTMIACDLLRAALILLLLAVAGSAVAHLHMARAT
jgi:MFS family permease